MYSEHVTRLLLRECIHISISVAVCLHIRVFEGSCVSFGETATDKLETQTDGVLQETFDSTHVFVRQLTVAFHPACQPWDGDK